MRIKLIKKNIVIFFILFFINLIVYYNSLNNNFIWDDIVLIVSNKNLDSVKNFLKIIDKDFFYDDKEEYSNKRGYYRPVITFSYFVDNQLWGKKPFGFHLTNLIIHFLNSLLIYFIIKHLTKQFSVALLTSIFFSIHPIHIQSVSWISGRTDLISAFFCLLSFYTFILFKNKKNNFILFIFSLISFLLSVFSKEMTLIFPFLLLIYLYLFHSVNKKRFLSDVKYIFPFFIISSFYFIFRLFIIRLNLTITSMDERIKLLNTFFIKGIPNYLFDLLFPFNLNFYKIINIVQLNIYTITLSFLIFVICIIIILLIKDKRLKFFYLFFLIFLIPLSNIIKISTPEQFIFPYAIRFMYIPSITVCFFISYIFLKLYNRFSKIKVIISFSIILLIILFSITIIKTNRVFKDEESFYKYCYEKNPNSITIAENLGVYYYEQKEYDKAIKYLKEAIRIEPDNIEAYYKLSVIYITLQQYKEGYNYCQRAYKLAPNKPDIWLIYSYLLFYYRNEIKESKILLSKYFEYDKTSKKAYELLLDILIIEKNFQELDRVMEKYYKLFPEDLTMLAKVSGQFARNNYFKEAIKYWDIYANYFSKDWRVYYNIGLAYIKLEEYEKGLYNMKKAYELNKDEMNILNKIKEIEKLIKLK